MKHIILGKEKELTIVQSLQTIARRVGVMLLLLSLTMVAQGLAAPEQSQKTFSSPYDAAQAMVDALRKNDRPELVAIFGKDSKGILISGDPVADNNAIQGFLKEYDQMHRFSRGSGGMLFLIVGAENWPLPIPLKKKAAGWYFDTPYGKQELLFRRIGANEYQAIDTLNAIVAGQHEYFDQTHENGATKQYAQRILSDPGTQDGLYWKAAPGRPESPIGPLVAKASREGYGAKSGEAPPFHGYYFTILTRQGKDAPGGAKNYIVDGKMIDGFAVLAYPTKYRSSGVMTFMVDANGNVLQKDLGPKTAEIAPAINSYDPNESWRPAP